MHETFKVRRFRGFWANANCWSRQPKQQGITTWKEEKSSCLSTMWSCLKRFFTQLCQRLAFQKKQKKTVKLTSQHWTGPQEVNASGAKVATCYLEVTSKQEEGGLIGVCVGVPITFYQAISAKESGYVWLAVWIQFIPQFIFEAKKIDWKNYRQLLMWLLMLFGIKIAIQAHGPPIQFSNLKASVR